MKKALLILSVVLLGIIGCKKDNSPKDPAAAQLIFPAKDEACTPGEIISATESSIVFTWKNSEDTDLYGLIIKNLESGVTTLYSTTNTELKITLSRNTPYSWTIVSKSEKTSSIAQSEVWKFYNSGPGTVSYAPFPAEIISPTMGQIINATAGKITLDWSGSDVDNDIASYDVYFGTNASPALFKSNLILSILVDVNVTSNTTYYWKIITKDAKGNTSDSAVYQLKVN